MKLIIYKKTNAGEENRAKKNGSRSVAVSFFSAYFFFCVFFWTTEKEQTFYRLPQVDDDRLYDDRLFFLLLQCSLFLWSSLFLPWQTWIFGNAPLAPSCHVPAAV